MQRNAFGLSVLRGCQERGRLGDYQVAGLACLASPHGPVLMAMLFMLEERLCQKENHPLLSCSDIETL